jgi:hypothetical protein
MFTSILTLSFSVKVETYNAPADVRILIFDKSAGMRAC